MNPIILDLAIVVILSEHPPLAVAAGDLIPQIYVADRQVQQVHCNVFLSDANQLQSTYAPLEFDDK